MANRCLWWCLMVNFILVNGGECHGEDAGIEDAAIFDAYGTRPRDSECLAMAAVNDGYQKGRDQFLRSRTIQEQLYVCDVCMGVSMFMVVPKNITQQPTMFAGKCGIIICGQYHMGTQRWPAPIFVVRLQNDFFTVGSACFTCICLCPAKAHTNYKRIKHTESCTYPVGRNAQPNSQPNSTLVFLKP